MWISTKEALTYILTSFDDVLLVLPINVFFHHFNQNAIVVLGKQWVPIVPPYNLDDIPSSATKNGFEFLDNFAIPTYWPVKSLQIAIDDENQIIQLLS